MKVTLKRINDDYLFDAKGPNEVSVLIDNKTGNTVQGAGPMELILMAVGGCNAIDIISILKKQRQPVNAYSIIVTGKRKEVREARPFESIHVEVHLEGDVVPAKAKRAAALSFEKYCSVSITLEGSVAITYQVFVNGKEV